MCSLDQEFYGGRKRSSLLVLFLGLETLEITFNKKHLYEIQVYSLLIIHSFIEAMLRFLTYFGQTQLILTVTFQVMQNCRQRYIFAMSNLQLVFSYIMLKMSLLSQESHFGIKSSCRRAHVLVPKLIQVTKSQLQIPLRKKSMH